MSETSANAKWIGDAANEVARGTRFSLVTHDIPRLKEIQAALESHAQLLAACKAAVRIKMLWRPPLPTRREGQEVDEASALYSLYDAFTAAIEAVEEGTR